MRTVYVGADEAGKGPVIGPMVAGAVRADPSSLPGGIDDSKRLSAERRETIAAALAGEESIETGLGVVGVEEIDAPDTDMNTLTVIAQARAIGAVVREGDRIVVDAGDVSADRFADRLARLLEEGSVGSPEEWAVGSLEVVAEHGADETDPVVGAASILAKVERDRRVAAIDGKFGSFGPIGSGYPSDPTTRSFLERFVRERGELPACARRSWSTCEDLLAAAEQSTFEEF